MIVTSMLLVIVGAVTLVVGIFTDQLELVYVSIGSCLLAGVFLIAGIVRGRPSRKPVVTGGGEQASWSGATGAWSPGGDELARDEAEPRPSGVAVVTEARDAGEREEAFQPAEEEEEIVVVPKRTAGSRGKKAAKKAGKKAAAKKAAKKGGKKAAKKAAAKKAGKKAAKKAAARKGGKKAAKKAGTRAADARRLDAALGDVAGLGPAKRKALLDHFGSYDALRAASARRLTEVNGVSDTLARRIKRAL